MLNIILVGGISLFNIKTYINIAIIIFKTNIYLIFYDICVFFFNKL